MSQGRGILWRPSTQLVKLTIVWLWTDWRISRFIRLCENNLLLCLRPHTTEALSDDAHLTSDVSLSVANIGPKSRRERPKKTKIGTEVAHVTCDSDTNFKVKGQLAGGGGGILWRPPAQLVLLLNSFSTQYMRAKYYKNKRWFQTIFWFDEVIERENIKMVQVFLPHSV